MKRDLTSCSAIVALVASLAPAAGQNFGFSRRDYPLPLPFTSILPTAAVDGGGIPELLIMDAEGISVLQIQDDGVSRKQVLVPLDGRPPRAVAADFNRDGKTDVIVGNVLYLSAADATVRRVALQDPLFSVQPFQSYLVTADFNKDGLQDVAGFDGSAFQVLLGSGDGTFQRSFSVQNLVAPAPNPSPGGPPLEIRSYAADIDRDGDPDLAVRTSGRGANPTVFRVFLGDGKGAFREGSNVRFPIPFAYTQTIADVNRDGVADWVLYSAQGTHVAWGQRDGSFGQPVLISPRASNTPAADFNGDGRLDIIIGDTLFLCAADGTFTSSVRIPAGEVARADWNRDGRLDLAVVHDDVVSILLNTSIGTGERILGIAESSAISRGMVSPGSLATLYGSGFSTRTEAAQTVSATLAGVQMRVRDAAGGTLPAELLYVSPTQINFRVPENAAIGKATLELAPSPQGSAPFEPVGIAYVEPVAPSLFLCRLNLLLSTAEAPAGFTHSQPKPCTAERYSYPAVATFYGTGFNGADLSNTVVTVNAVPVKVLFAGPAGTVPGLDKIVVRVEAEDLVESMSFVGGDPYSSWTHITVKGLRANGGYTNLY